MNEVLIKIGNNFRKLSASKNEVIQKIKLSKKNYQKLSPELLFLKAKSENDF